MAKGQFSKLQTEHINSYLPEFIKKLDADVSGLELTRWKQATATKVLASPAFGDLDYSKNSRAKWHEMIVRKYTNYLHQTYRKTHPETPSPSEVIKANPLLKFSSVLSGRQLLARDMHEDIMDSSRKHVTDKGTNEAAAYQTIVKQMWDALTAEEKSEWETKAEDECGDVKLNQTEFVPNIHKALRSLCQGGMVGDAEMMLFYAFREPRTGDLVAGTQHNTTNFGGEDLATTYGFPWSQFSETVLPLSVNSNGTVNLPQLDLETTPLASLRHLLNEYFEQCWGRNSQDGSEEASIPWGAIAEDPARFYNTEEFIFPLPLKDPSQFTRVEILTIVECLSTSCSPAFCFRHGIVMGTDQTPPVPPAQTTSAPGSPATTQSRSPSPIDVPSPKTLQDIPENESDSPIPMAPLPDGKPRRGGKKRLRNEGPVAESDSRSSKKSKVKARNENITAVSSAPRRSSRTGKGDQNAAASKSKTRRATTKKDAQKSQWKGYALVSESEDE
ncbi:hypothetical protein B0H11DRAFT_1932617 [Mycena galericulata]|nr:hypothetical protein B0H11DRAFT_1932617 [Mycena galericulata]